LYFSQAEHHNFKEAATIYNQMHLNHTQKEGALYRSEPWTKEEENTFVDVSRDGNPSS
jgi:hypothetical protein